MAGSEYYVVEDEDEVIGGCGNYPTEGLPSGYCELVKFYFVPKPRGKGIGRELIQKVIESAKAVGYHHMYIESFPEIGPFPRLGLPRDWAFPEIGPSSRLGLSRDWAFLELGLP